MARDKSTKQRDNETRPRKTTLSDKRKGGGRDRGYQNLADVMFNGGVNPPKN